LEWEKMNTAQDRFFCYDLGINLTENDCCHEDTSPYVAQCPLMKPLSVDTFACVIYFIKRLHF